MSGLPWRPECATPKTSTVRLSDYTAARLSDRRDRARVLAGTGARLWSPRAAMCAAAAPSACAARARTASGWICRASPSTASRSTTIAIPHRAGQAHHRRSAGVVPSRYRHAHQSRRRTRTSKASTCPAAASARSAKRRASAPSPIALDRPDVLARYAVRIEADKAAYPTLLSNGNLTESGEHGGRAPLRRVDRSAPEALRTCSRSAPANTSRSTTSSSPRAAARWRSASMSIRAMRPRALRHGCAEARHEVGRGRVPARIRSRRLQHRRRARLQFRRDGEQGPQHLQLVADPRRRRTRRRTRTSKRSKPSSATNTSTTGPATASPAATGSSSA